ncbi:GIY-YIG nuclease family protein [Pandoraea cepalis]|uniref:Bacteriophage T5 Orf172 DNA-binding domain-containing protein n=1 Tax=Pandoraea cepalis TaxID=2508294 RepID=A0A5E4YP92_9BURK|nr:GIY-YIG nuclease family protein [Pandoraea cepalis]VVE50317.1 hypothetical protein PCE31107_04663 [Pandoraea cepalis]
MNKDDLLKLIADDDMGLLDVKSKREALGTDERLLNSFKEIEQFYLEHKREPEANKEDMTEFRLHSRLAGLRASQDKRTSLFPFDECGLLTVTPTSIADVFNDDDMGLLGSSDEDIFKLRHVPASIEMPETIASRKPCKDFEDFEQLFKTCHEELASGIREARAFTGEQQIQVGHFFILHGVMAYVAHVGEKEAKKGKVNARLRCIFENGTESNMLLRSLATELYKDEAGRRILDHQDKALEDLASLGGDDKLAGYIYIVTSLSPKPGIAGIKNLYKIGFSTVPVEERVRNASQEATYLMAPVRIVTAFECYNVNVQKFESLLHAFFGKNCLDLAVVDKNGKRIQPREWFVAPLAAIEMAVQLLINGEIVHYRYDGDIEDVVAR